MNLFPKRAKGTSARMARLAIAGAAAMGLAGVGVAITSTPAFAAGALTGVTFTPSNNALSTGAGGANNTAVYTWNFTTATAGVLTQLTFTTPTGTTLASPTIVTKGLGACTAGTPSGSTTVTVALTTCGTIPVGRVVYVSITGFTNSTTQTTGSFSSVVSTFTGAGPTLNDQGTASAITFASNQTAINIIVPDSLTFTNGNTSVTMLPVPGATSPVNADATVPLTVSTNARNGYTLSGCMTTAPTGGTSGATIPEASGTATPLSQANPGVGAQVSVTTPGGATLQGQYASANGSNYVGYATTCATSGASLITKQTGTTTGDVTTITNGVIVSATQAADTYTGTVSYLVSPSF
jgi:hypothetical protein